MVRGLLLLLVSVWFWSRQAAGTVSAGKGGGTSILAHYYCATAAVVDSFTHSLSQSAGSDGHSQLKKEHHY